MSKFCAMHVGQTRTFIRIHESPRGIFFDSVHEQVRDPQAHEKIPSPQCDCLCALSVAVQDATVFLSEGDSPYHPKSL
jgi:hypothetical protein